MAGRQARGAYVDQHDGDLFFSCSFAQNKTLRLSKTAKSPCEGIAKVEILLPAVFEDHTDQQSSINLQASISLEKLLGLQ